MLEVDIKLRRGAFNLQATFNAPTPGVTALFGRSGCGKTTLVNLLAGLAREGQGRIALDGHTWLDTHANLRVPAERRGVGYVFQDARLFPHYSVRGNLLYGARGMNTGATGTSASAHSNTHNQRFDEIIALLNLEALLNRRPNSLSGGEKQRVALGRALLSNPRLLLLDEPLASLDAARREEVLPWLERLRDHLSIPMIFVSHQFEDVLRLATQILVMDAGHIVASGDVGSVSLSPALQAIVGPEALGAVLEGRVTAVDTTTDLAEVALGNGTLRIPTNGVTTGQRLRVQLLARDLILAVQEPRGLSVRNQLRGRVTAIDSTASGDLLRIDIGGHELLARITHAATRELNLTPGSAVWVLVKAVQAGGHSFSAAAHENTVAHSLVLPPARNP
jgi:molybdate transport system ATP-binding protein